MMESEKKHETKNEGPEDGGFDQRLRRLEVLVAELEQGGLGLEPAIERYQEGIELLKSCHQALAAHRRRVEELTREAEEAMRPFQADPDFAGPDARA